MRNEIWITVTKSPLANWFRLNHGKITPVLIMQSWRTRGENNSIINWKSMIKSQQNKPRVVVYLLSCNTCIISNRNVDK